MDSSHLSVVLDLDPGQWFRAGSFDQFLDHLLAFLNAHIALRADNSLAVFGALPAKSVMLYPADVPVHLDPNSYPPFKLLDTALVDNISSHLHAPHLPIDQPSALVAALTMALCYINRLDQPSDHPRILILSVSPDLSTSYIPIMNAIFSAQKLKVTIDACQIFGPDTVFLQQAAHLTSGSYLYLEHRDALLQYLIMSFLPPPPLRSILAVPTQDRVDFRAACFCHKNIVDIGFVCSVCLSIFCQPVPVCSTCRTKFPIKTLKRLNAARLPSAPSPPVPAQPHPHGSPPQNGSNGAQH